MKAKLITIALSMGLLMYSNGLYAADKGDTKIAAAAVAGAVVFGGIAIFNALTKRKK